MVRMQRLPAAIGTPLRNGGKPPVWGVIFRAALQDEEARVGVVGLDDR
jgi:hypothetical protein